MEPTRGLRAGVSRVELDPPLGLPMMGYGARHGVAGDRHDPLTVRAVFFENQGHAFLLVEVDVCLLAVQQAAAVRDRISARTGLAPTQVMIACIHTHSAPDTGLLRVLLGRPVPQEIGALLDQVVEAAVAACEAAQPARLGVGTAPVSIGRNRRSQGASVDPDAIVLRVDRADASPLAVLYIHGCHPTVLGHDNLAYSADWPGAASAVIEAALPGSVAVFALGAPADVDPRTRGLLDLSIRDQSVGVGFDEMEGLGREVGHAVAKVAADLETSAAVEIAAASRPIRLPVHGARQGESGRRAVLDRRRREALRALGLDEDLEPGVAEWYRLEAEHTAGLAAAEVRERSSRVRLLLRDQTAKRIAGDLAADVEVQVARIGCVWLLGLPLEVTVDVGQAWRAEVGQAGSVVSISNGWLRYLPHADHFDEPQARHKYEILNSTFVPEAADALLAAGLALRTELTKGAQA